MLGRVSACVGTAASVFQVTLASRRRFPPSVLRRCVVSGCDEEPQCSVADLRDADSAGFFSCSLYPDSRVCGAYDKPLRRPCSPLLDRAPNNTYSKKGKEGSSESHCHDFIAAPAVFKHRVCVCVCAFSRSVWTSEELL